MIRRAILALIAAPLLAGRKKTYAESIYEDYERFRKAVARFGKVHDSISEASPDYPERMAEAFIENDLGGLFRRWEDNVLRRI